MMVPAYRSELFNLDELGRLRHNLFFPERYCPKYGCCDVHRDDTGRTACQLCLDPRYKEDLNLWTREFLTKMNEPGWVNDILRGHFRKMRQDGMLRACAWQAIFEFCSFTTIEVKGQTNLSKLTDATEAMGKACSRASENSQIIRNQLDEFRVAFDDSKIRGNKELSKLVERLAEYSKVAGLVIADHKSVIADDLETLECLDCEGHKYLEVLRPADMKLRCWPELATVLNHGIRIRLSNDEQEMFGGFTRDSLRHDFTRRRDHDAMLRRQADQISPGLYNRIEYGPLTPELLETVRAHEQKQSQLPENLKATVEPLLANTSAKTEVQEDTPAVDQMTQKHISRVERTNAAG